MQFPWFFEWDNNVKLALSKTVNSWNQFGTQVDFRRLNDHNMLDASKNPFSAPWYVSEMEL